MVSILIYSLLSFLKVINVYITIAWQLEHNTVRMYIQFFFQALVHFVLLTPYVSTGYVL